MVISAWINSSESMGYGRASISAAQIRKAVACTFVESTVFCCQRKRVLTLLLCPWSADWFLRREE